MQDILTTVFVYGTLMPGERNAHVAATDGKFTSQPASLPGFRLLHLLPEAYPAVMAGASEDVVHGYALTYSAANWPTVLPYLDALEGLHEVPPLYTRNEVELRGENGEVIRSWVYLYARAERLRQPGVIPLPGGDWREIEGRSQHGPEDK